MGVFRYKITLFFSTSGRNIKPTARGNPRISISYHGNVTPYFMHIGMVSDDRGMGIRGEWIIVLFHEICLTDHCNDKIFNHINKGSI